MDDLQEYEQAHGIIDDVMGEEEEIPDEIVCQRDTARRTNSWCVVINSPQAKGCSHSHFNPFVIVILFYSPIAGFVSDKLFVSYHPTIQ